MTKLMKTNLSILLGFFTLSASAAEFHIAPNGSDASPGTAGQPFATLEKARDAARETRSQESGARSQNVILLAAGTYRLTRIFELNEKDSSTVFRAAPGADVRLSGSVAIPAGAAKPVADKAVLDRLLPEVQGKVLEIDLKPLGIADFGEIGPRGFRRPYIPAPLELFIDDQPLMLAQWPNPGEPGEPIGKVLDKGPKTRDGAKPDRGGIFEFKTDRPARWAQAKDIWITGLFENGYADNTVQVKAFDLAKKTLTTVQPHMYGFSSGRPWNRWTALNLLEEIDLPGEFFADKESGKLYFLPPAGKDIAKCRLEISMLKVPLVAIEGATGVVFDGITFENSRGMGVYIERGANNRIQNCTLRNLGIVAICVGKGISPDPDYRHGFTGEPVSRALGSWHEHIYENTAFNRDAGTGHGIVNCQIYNIGAGAISLGGGDRKTLAPAGNFVENCDIHHFNRWDRSYKGAVNLDGVGNRITHCRLHEAPALVIYLHGNDHLIEANEICDAMLDGDDMGAIYMGRDPSEYGNVLRHNFIHHIGNEVDAWRNGLYLDDGSCGLIAEGNVFCKCVCNVAINGGYHKFTNNIFMAAKRNSGVPAGNPPEKWHAWSRTPMLEKRLRQAVDVTAPPYSVHYPELKTLYEAPPQARRCSIVWNNVYFWPGEQIGDKPANDNRNNFQTKEDPGFADAGKMDFRLLDDSVVFKKIPGFKPIPFETIGLKKKDRAEDHH